jgi:hypothetical protein
MDDKASVEGRGREAAGRWRQRVLISSTWELGTRSMGAISNHHVLGNDTDKKQLGPMSAAALRYPPSPLTRSGHFRQRIRV